MRKETRANRAMSTAVGYLLAVVGFIVMMLFFALNRLPFAASIVTDLMGGAGSTLGESLGTIMWLGVGILLLGIAIVMIEETKEEE